MNDNEKSNNKLEDQKSGISNQENEESSNKAQYEEQDIDEEHNNPLYEEVGAFDQKEKAETEENEKKENGSTDDTIKKQQNKESSDSKKNEVEASDKNNGNSGIIDINYDEKKGIKENSKKEKSKDIKPDEAKKEVETPQIKYRGNTTNEAILESKYISPSSSEKELNEEKNPTKNNVDINGNAKHSESMSISDKDENENKDSEGEENNNRDHMSISSSGHQNQNDNSEDTKMYYESTYFETVHTLPNITGFNSNNPEEDNFNDLEDLNQGTGNENPDKEKEIVYLNSFKPPESN